MDKRYSQRYAHHHVHDVYNSIAHQFDKTRFALWPCVTSFLDELPLTCRLLDVGCGNGKYLSYKEFTEVHACDACEELVDIAKCKHKVAHVIVANGLHLPYKDNMFDAVISVAVFHHLTSKYDRIRFLQEMARVIRSGGKALVTVWASCMQDKRKKNWIKAEPEPESECAKDSESYLVGWKNSLLRYYHLFNKDELVNYCSSIGILKVDKVYYERDNFVVHLEKI